MRFKVLLTVECGRTDDDDRDAEPYRDDFGSTLQWGEIKGDIANYEIVAVESA